MNSYKTNASKNVMNNTPPENERTFSIKTDKRDVINACDPILQLGQRKKNSTFKKSFLGQLREFYYGQHNRYHCINVKFLECDNDNCYKVGEYPCSKKTAEAFRGGMS